MPLALVVCLALGVLLLLAAVVTIVALRQAPDGYEDDSGFHSAGSFPRSRSRQGRQRSEGLAGATAAKAGPGEKLAGGIVVVS